MDTAAGFRVAPAANLNGSGLVSLEIAVLGDIISDSDHFWKIMFQPSLRKGYFGTNGS